MARTVQPFFLLSLDLNTRVADRAAIEPDRGVQIGSGKLEVGSWKLEIGSRKSEIGIGKSEVGSGKSEVGSGKWEVRSLTMQH